MNAQRLAGHVHDEREASKPIRMSAGFSPHSRKTGAMLTPSIVSEGQLR